MDLLPLFSPEMIMPSPPGPRSEMPLVMAGRALCSTMAPVSSGAKCRPLNAGYSRLTSVQLACALGHHRRENIVAGPPNLQVLKQREFLDAKW